MEIKGNPVVKPSRNLRSIIRAFKIPPPLLTFFIVHQKQNFVNHFKFQYICVKILLVNKKENLHGESY